MLQMKITIKAKNGKLVQRKVVFTEWISNTGERSITATDGRYTYVKTNEFYNDFGQPVTIWEVKK